MKVFSALVWRECFERRLLLLASAFLGIIPLVMPWLPGSYTHIEPQDLRLAAAVVLTVLFGGVTLVILGSTIVGRDLSEGRLGFYFSRPISAWTLWSSRIVAACGLLFASLSLLAGPTLLLEIESLAEHFSGSSSGRSWPVLGLREVFLPNFTWYTLPERPHRVLQLAGLLILLVALLVLVHAASTIIRGRNAWVLADLVGLAIVVTLGWRARNLMVQEEALGALVWSEWLLVPWILVAGVVAGAVQLARGRTDLESGHHYLSATLWSALILGVLIFNGYAHYVGASSLGDLEDVSFVRPSPNEEWLVTGGPVRHRARTQAAFLIDTNTERSWRLGSLGVVHSWLKFSADSSTVVWARCKSFVKLDCRMWAKDLRAADSPSYLTEVPISSTPQQLAISRDGSRVAFAEPRRLVVYDLSSGNLLAAVDANQPYDVAFASASRIRFQEVTDDADGSMKRVQQFDITSRQKTELGQLPMGHRTFQSPRDGRIVYSQIYPPGFGLYDSDTGEQIGDFHPRRSLPSQALFLADGRSVLIFRNGFEASVTVLSKDGHEDFTIAGPRVSSIRFGGEISPGRVLIGFNELLADPLAAPHELEKLERFLGWTTYVFDVETRQLDVMGVGVTPVGSPLEMLSTRLFMAGGKTVIRWDLESTNYQTLVGPHNVGQLREGTLVFDPMADGQG